MFHGFWGVESWPTTTRRRVDAGAFVPAAQAGRSDTRAHRAFPAPAHPARPWLAPRGPHYRLLRHDRVRGASP